MQFASSPSCTDCTSDYLKQISCNLTAERKMKPSSQQRYAFLVRKRTAAF